MKYICIFFEYCWYRELTFMKRHPSNYPNPEGSAIGAFAYTFGMNMVFVFHLSYRVLLELFNIPIVCETIPLSMLMGMYYSDRIFDFSDKNFKRLSKKYKNERFRTLKGWGVLLYTSIITIGLMGLGIYIVAIKEGREKISILGWDFWSSLR